MKPDILEENSEEEVPEGIGPEEVLTRRHLLKTVAGSCLLLALPVLAEAGPFLGWPPARWEAAGPMSRFKTGVTMRTVLLGGLVVFITRRDDQHLSALSSVCTHQGCEIGWNAGQKQFICPCHGSRFSAVGGVLRGPAHRQLGAFTVMQKNGQVLVDVGTHGTAPGAANSRPVA